MIISQFTAFWEKLTTRPEFAVTVAVTIIALTVLYYYIMKFLVYNNSGQLIFIFVLIMVISGCVIMFNDSISNFFYILVPSVMILLLVAMYSVEFKRLIWTKKNNKFIDVKRGGDFFDEESIKGCVAEIIKALQDMSKNDVGAIIVLSNENVPKQILDSGVRLNSDISSALIESVFFPKTPLHDGAMVISGTKIVAAGCFLPLTQKDNLPKDLGTRHRAGIGVTETIDVVSIIVSEETGIISVVKAGKITRYADLEMLKKTLTKYYWTDFEPGKKGDRL